MNSAVSQNYQNSQIEMNGSHQKCDSVKKANNRCCSIMTFLTGFFFLTTCAAVALLIWKLYFYRKSITGDNLRDKFPGFFRSSDEQIVFQNRLIDIGLKVVWDKQNITKFCNSDCRSRPWYQKTAKVRRSAQQSQSVWGDSVYHGCCQSSVYFTAPTTLPNMEGVTKTFVQIDGSQQFYQSSTCIQDPNCSGCTCTYQEEIYTAVCYKAGVSADVATIDDLEIDLFQFDGCCKCVNDGSS